MSRVQSSTGVLAITPPPPPHTHPRGAGLAGRGVRGQPQPSPALGSVGSALHPSLAAAGPAAALPLPQGRATRLAAPVDEGAAAPPFTSIPCGYPSVNRVNS